MPKFTDKDLTTLAQEWLRGEQLSSEDMGRLGLPPEFPNDVEQESAARSVVLSLLELSGSTTSIFLFFDEVEAIQSSNYDDFVLRQFGTLATDLLAQPGKRVVAISIRPILQMRFQKAVESSNYQKLTQYRAIINPLTWEQTVRITRARLDSEATCKAFRQQHLHDSDWPLGNSFLEATFKSNRRTLTPRALITECKNEFERVLNGRKPVNTASYTQRKGEDAKGSQIACDEWSRMWDKQRKKYLERPQSIQFDNVFALALPWLTELMELPLVRVYELDSRLGDVNLWFHPQKGGDTLGVSFCNQEPKILWRRLDRLKQQWDLGRKESLLGSLILLRAKSSAISDASKSRLKVLTECGVRIIPIDREQLAELTAFQVMLTATLEGDMTRAGAPVEANEFDLWTKEHLSGSVKALLDDIFEIHHTPKRPAVKEPKKVVGRKVT